MKDEPITALEPLVRRVRTDATAIRGAKGVVWTRDELTPERLAKHLNGGPARGVCPIKAGESTTMVGVLDLDSHKGESTWEQMTEVAEQVIEVLAARGMRANPWRSGGGNGIHLIVLWDEPQDAFSVRQALIGALMALGYTNGTAGVAKRQIEVFPKQDSVPADGFGNQFFLPLGGKSEPLVLELGLAPGGRQEAVGYAWQTSDPVPVLERPSRAAAPSHRVEDLSLLDRALWSIPNDIDSRDEWFLLMCAYKDGGGEKETARSWTAQHPSYDEGKFDTPWDSITPGKAGGVTVDYLFKLAHERGGFTEHIVAEFPVVEAPAVEVMPAFTRDKQGRIEPTITNAVAALRSKEFVQARVGHDRFKDTVMVAHNCAGAWRPLRDTDYTEMRMRLEARGFKAPGRELIRDAVLKVAEDYEFDSAIQWGESLVWDGVPRVDSCMARYFRTEANPYATAVSRYLWTALAGRMLTPGEEVHMAVVLVGAQGSGKSRGVRLLAPEPDAYVEINLEHRDDNLARSLRGKLVGELGELRGLQSRDADSIKAWISRSHEEWTPKYMEFATKFPRRLVLIGTTNTTDFLADETGERRWLPVEVGETDLEALARDRDQLWAEAVQLYRSGGVQWLNAQALAKSEHSKFKVVDMWHEPIARWLAEDGEFEAPGTAPRSAAPFKLNVLLQQALGLPPAAQGVKEQKRAARVLRALGFEQRRATRSEGGKNVWVAVEKSTVGESVESDELA